MKYKCFISYSHKDEPLANLLFKKLDGYLPPKEFRSKEEKAWRIFIDHEELAASHDLEDRIKTALDESQVLIVIASDHSMSSVYVVMEVKYFSQFTDRQILTVVSDHRESNDINEYISNYEEYQRPEPLALDVRSNSERQLTKKIIAGILEVEYGDLVDREQARRTKRILLASVGMSTIVGLFFVLSLLAIVQLGKTSQSLAQSKTSDGFRALENNELGKAEEYFKEALFINDNVLAREGLSQTLLDPLKFFNSIDLAESVAIQGGYARNEAEQLTSIEYVSDTDVLVLNSSDDLKRINADTGEIIWHSSASSNAQNEGEFVTKALDVDFVTGLAAASVSNGDIRFVDIETGSEIDRVEIGAEILALRFNSETLSLAVGTHQGVQLITQSGDVEFDLMHSHAGTVQGLAFSKSLNLFLWGGSTSRIWGCDLEDLPCQQLSYVDRFVYSIDENDSGRMVAYAEGEQTNVVE